jgi:hypothetical protein
MKNVISILLFVNIALFASAYDFKVDGIAYRIISDGVSVSVTNEITNSQGSSAGYSNLSGALVIPSSVTYEGITYSVICIDSNAFEGCAGLTSVSIPNSVTTIGIDAFKDCTGLTKVNISDLTAWCNFVFYTQSSNPLLYAHNLYINDVQVTNLSIPNSITNIKDYAFTCCTSLTSVSIPNSVTSIGNCAFNGCSDLTDVNIPNSVTNIGHGAFAVSGLTSVSIPDSVTLVGYQAFSSCNSLASVSWNAKNCDIDSRHGLTPFWNSSNILLFEFGENVEKIPDCLCLELTGLQTIVISNSVTSIGNEAFYGCTSLNTAIIGESVTSIGNYAFKGCSLLENLVAMRERPIVIPSNTFEGVPKASCDLHVREGSKIRYKNQDVWKDFLIIVEDAEDWADVSGGSSGSGVYGDVNGDGFVNAADVTAVYDILLGN